MKNTLSEFLKRIFFQLFGPKIEYSRNMCQFWFLWWVLNVIHSQHISKFSDDWFHLFHWIKRKKCNNPVQTNRKDLESYFFRMLENWRIGVLGSFLYFGFRDGRHRSEGRHMPQVCQIWHVGVVVRIQRGVDLLNLHVVRWNQVRVFL